MVFLKFAQGHVRRHVSIKKIIMEENRRSFIKKSTAVAALALTGIGSASATHSNKYNRPLSNNNKIKWPLTEGVNTPKLVLGCPLKADVKQMRRLKQIGVDNVSNGGWTNQEALSNPK